MKNNTDWVAIARGLGWNKYAAKELAHAFKEKSWYVLGDPTFQKFFAGFVESEFDTCGSGCCDEHRIVGPNGFVVFSLSPAEGWKIQHGSLNVGRNGVKSFESYPEWLACYKLRLRNRRLV